MIEDALRNIENADKLSKLIAAEVTKKTEWTPDCMGKMDFDISLFNLSTRYYPDNTAYGTLYLSTEGGGCVDGIKLAEFKSEPGEKLGAPDAKAELEKLAREHITKFVYALLRVTEPQVIRDALKEAGL